MLEKNGSRWIIDQENMVALAVSYFKIMRFCSVILAIGDPAWNKIEPGCLISTGHIWTCISSTFLIFTIRIHTKELLKPAPYCPITCRSFTLCPVNIVGCLRGIMTKLELMQKKQKKKKKKKKKQQKM